MNGNTFSLLGYLSTLLWLGVPLLWIMRKRSRWACLAALALSLLALLFAKINSEYHVDRIAPDRSAQNENMRAKEEAKRKTVENARANDVADIRFAEDKTGDFLDKAGLEESDLKYLDSQNNESEPEWKKNKKNRGTAEPTDGSLDSLLGGQEAIDGVKTEALEEKQDKPPILMSDADMATAHRLDGLNLTVILVLILLALVMLVIDYLSRANVYAQAALPLPLPSAWRDTFCKTPPVVDRPAPARRNVATELAWLAKRGDCFVYLTDDAAATAALPSSLPRLGKSWRSVDLLRVDEKLINDNFVFESLWYGRACFVVDSAKRTEQMLARFLILLEERRKVQARVSQTVHVVWDLQRPPSEHETEAFARLAKATGFSLFLCRTSHPSL